MAVSSSTRGLGPTFHRMWAQRGVVNLADGVLMTAAALLAVGVTRSPLQVSLVSASATLPWLLTTLFAGVVADRYDRRRVMLVTNLVRVAGARDRCRRGGERVAVGAAAVRAGPGARHLRGLPRHLRPGDGAGARPQGPARGGERAAADHRAGGELLPRRPAGRPARGARRRLGPRACPVCCTSPGRCCSSASGAGSGRPGRCPRPATPRPCAPRSPRACGSSSGTRSSGRSRWWQAPRTPPTRPSSPCSCCGWSGPARRWAPRRRCSACWSRAWPWAPWPARCWPPGPSSGSARCACCSPPGSSTRW